ncbi:LemA family protein [Rhodococcus sp. 14C212]|uniref:LemA family protein n=1 Tax=Rhodococcus sp. 14C212 TaxID=2711209 RepID=UPI0009CFFD25|nr:LemA family protein [Rhodococcus sp. 14C212]NGP07579.1 LemA family protein [Rhodococcus sp. 14C212]OOL31948.1 LemA family protein [Rhodococcus rhodochrous]
MVTAIVIVVVLVVVLGAVFVVGFNRLRRADVLAQEALGGIDVQLSRRADLVPNLVATVRGYAAHEKSVFEEVTAARTAASRAASGGTVAEKAQADARLEKAVFDVLAVAENYPDLKASANFLDLQRQLGETEDQLAFARQYYNDAAGRLNTSLKTIPWMFFAGPAGVREREFYTAPAGTELPPTVSF